MASNANPLLHVYTTSGVISSRTGNDCHHEVYVDSRTGMVEVYSVFARDMHAGSSRSPSLMHRSVPRRGATFNRVMRDMAEHHGD